MSNVVTLRGNRKFTDEMATQATRCLMVEAFLRRRVKTFRTLATVSVSFKSELEAEEFHKLLNRTRRNQESTNGK